MNTRKRRRGHWTKLQTRPSRDNSFRTKSIERLEKIATMNSTIERDLSAKIHLPPTILCTVSGKVREGRILRVCYAQWQASVKEKNGYQEISFPAGEQRLLLSVGLDMLRSVLFPKIISMICISQILGDIQDFTPVAVVSGFVLPH